MYIKIRVVWNGLDFNDITIITVNTHDRNRKSIQHKNEWKEK